MWSTPDYSYEAQVPIDTHPRATLAARIFDFQKKQKKGRARFYAIRLKLVNTCLVTN